MTTQEENMTTTAIEIPAPTFSRRDGYPAELSATTPATLLSIAVRGGANLDQLERLMVLQEKWEANEARKAFNVAFAAFKAESVQIIKGSVIKDGPLKGKSHADLFDVVSAVTPALSKHGLSTAWQLTKDDPSWMEVTCTLSHVAGYSESASMGGAPDTGPGRNAIQARGSVKTYLERYTLTGILGLAAQDADDDGNGGDKDKDKGDASRKEKEPKPLPAYTPEQVTAQLPAWRKLIADGARTADDVINALQTRYTISEDQIKRISTALKPTQGEIE